MAIHRSTSLRRRTLGTLAAMSVMALSGQAQAAKPLEPRMHLCAATADGPTPADRKVVIQWHYREISIGCDAACVAAAIDLVQRVRICQQTATARVCPPQWIVYDKGNATPIVGGSGPPAAAQILPIVVDPPTLSAASATISFDWTADVAQDGALLFVVQVETADGKPVVAPLEGYCPVPRRFLSQPYAPSGTDPAWLIGASTASAAPPGVSNACTGGKTSSIPAPDNACTEPSHGAWQIKMAQPMLQWQKSVLPDVTPPHSVYASCAGYPFGAGTYCPYLGTVLVDYPAHAGDGLFQLPPNPSAIAPSAYFAPEQGGEFGTIAHELWHSVQSSQTRGASDAVMQVYGARSHWEPFFESGAESFRFSSCADNVEGIPPNMVGKIPCPSWGRFGNFPAGDGYAAAWLDTPSQDLLAISYTGALFWRYLSDQWALTPASAKKVGRDKKTQAILPINVRRADEGTDIFADIVTAWKTAPKGQAYQLIDGVTTTKLNRSLRRVMLDLHTAVALKEYALGDEPAWRFLWFGDHNAGGFTFSGAPAAYDALTYPVPVAPNVSGPPTAMVTRPDVNGAPATVENRFDGLRRAKRIVDHRGACTGCTEATVQKLPAANQLAGAGLQLEPNGAAYLSVVPADGFGPFRVKLRAPKQGKEPAFRVFTVTNGAAKLVAACDTPDAQDRACPLDETGLFTYSPTNLPSDTEILVVVSGHPYHATLFDYSIGGYTPIVKILDPRASHPADVGKAAQSPGGGGGGAGGVGGSGGGGPAPVLAKEPFLVQLQLFDIDGTPLELSAGQLNLSVACASGAPGCTATLVEGNDYTLTQVGLGEYWALVSPLPDTVLGPASAGDSFLDLRASLFPTQVDVAVAALHVGSPRQRAVQIIVDATTAKTAVVANVQAAGQALVRSLIADADVGGSVPPPLLGFVAYSDIGWTPPYGNAAQKGGLGFSIAGNDSLLAAGVSFFPGVLPSYYGGAASCTPTPTTGVGAIGDALATMQSNFVLGANPTTGPGWDAVPTAGAPVAPDLQAVVLAVAPEASGPEGSNPTCDIKTYVRSYCDYFGGSANKTTASACGVLERPWTPGGFGHLSYQQRNDTGQYLSPTISTLAIGDQAPQGALQFLSLTSQGAFEVVLTGPGSTQALSAPLQTFDAVGHLHDVVSAREHVISLSGAQLALVPPLFVEKGASDLAVSIGSVGRAVNQVRLIGPDGGAHAAVETTDDHNFAAFRVASPQPGVWTYEVPSSITAGDPGGSVIVEQSVRSPIKMFVSARPAKLSTSPADASLNAGSFVGRPAKILALTTDGSPVTTANYAYALRRPDGSILSGVLSDDGLHHDGKAGDGVFGHVLSCKALSQAGAYQLRVLEQGTSTHFGTAFTREKLLAIEVHEGVDTDGDHMPDWWEIEHGTDPNVADADADPDHDGLINRREYLACTDPLSADTDGGGESDLSELNHGRDPADPSDDAASAPVPTLLPGNGKLLLTVPALLPGAVLYVESVPNSGPGTVIYSGPPGDIGAGRVAGSEVATPLSFPNDVPACVRVSVGGDAATGWSPTLCATPKLDPYAPEVTVTVAAARSRRVHVEVGAVDDPRHFHAVLATDPKAYVTGPKDMMLSASYDFAGSSWQPYATHTIFRAPKGSQHLYVKVRDDAGNVSRIEHVNLSFERRGAIARAIFLEEEALDALDAKDWTSAAQSIAASLPLIDEAIATLETKRSAHHLGDDCDDCDTLPAVIERLKAVRGRKSHALDKVNPKGAAKAVELLHDALEEEIEIATSAARTGHPL